MKQSFIDAGFDEKRCRFSVFDNSAGNNHEVYGAINKVLRESSEPYVIFCHQDVILNKGHGIDRLLQIIDDLNALDVRWAVFGNAGVTEDYILDRRLADPHGDDCGPIRTPVRVCSLDEDFLTIDANAGLSCSPELRGFHLYATDLCLHAITAGRSCYVASFYLSHLSAGRRDANFAIARDAFRRRWQSNFKFRYIRTTATFVLLSRIRGIRWILGFGKVGYLLVMKSEAARKIVMRFSDTIYPT